MKIRRGNPSAALVNFRKCFFLSVSWHLCNLIFQIAMWKYIDRLSVYMASNGRHYANHYATLRKWLNEDIRSGNTKTYTAEDYSEGECLCI